MKYRFKAVCHTNNQNLFDHSYINHDAAMQAAFAYVDLYVENDQIIDKLVGSIINDNYADQMSLIHDDMLYVIEPDDISNPTKSPPQIKLS